MWVVVGVLLYFEYLVRLLKLDRDVDVEVLGSGCSLLVVATIYGELWVVCILHEATLILLVRVGNTLLSKLLVELLSKIELTSEVNHRTCLATLVNHEE